MKGEQNRKGRLQLQLKIQNEQKRITRETSYRSKTSSKLAGSYCLERPAKGRPNPQEPPSSSVFFPKKYLNKVSNVVFTLPELSPSLDSELAESTLFEQSKVQSYYNAKLGPFLTTHKNISARYYKQLSQLKEIKEPAVAQKILTIMDMRNSELDEAARGRGVKGKVRRLSFPASAIDRYQLVRQRDEREVPLQLMARKCQRGVSTQAKKQMHAKFELSVKRRKASPVRESHQIGFKLSGWQSDLPPMHEY